MSTKLVKNLQQGDVVKKPYGDEICTVFEIDPREGYYQLLYTDGRTDGTTWEDWTRISQEVGEMEVELV